MYPAVVGCRVCVAKVAPFGLVVGLLEIGSQGH
uniref:Uncharacterized protein n=1 Tax=Arundo donax TaxID=35708 RepID=A0A0A8YYH9_ARUDO